MNFDFSEEDRVFQAQVRRLLDARCGSAALHAFADDGESAIDRALWRSLADLGALGAAIPELYGGAGADALVACLVAEEIGRAVAPVPFLSAIGLAAEALMLAGSEAQKARYLPSLAAGAAIASFSGDSLEIVDGRASGVLRAVPAGGEAQWVVALAGERLHIVTLGGEGTMHVSSPNIDPLLGHADIMLAGATAEPLVRADAASLAALLDRAAVLCAFEQLGGAERALATARDYALVRNAFGRPIGAFQAIKHRLADLYVAATLARSNCHYAAWALSARAVELPLAAATALLSAAQAYSLCARENIQIHGGIGFTWEADCHFHYRRALRLSRALGPQRDWAIRLAQHLPEALQ